MRASISICLSVLSTSAAVAQTPVASGAQLSAPPLAVDTLFKPDTTPPAEFATFKPVPHGEVRIVWYDSKVFGTQRRMHIYLPPFYSAQRQSYPVLYLIHGGGENDSAWTDAFAPYIFDNLIAAGKMRPMIVVMPNGQVSPGFGAHGATTPEALAERASISNAERAQFVSSLVTDIIPLIDRSYRVRTDRESRAIAGYSFGGAEALWAGVQHPDLFAWLGIFSMGIQGGSDADRGSIAGSGSSATPSEFVEQNRTFFDDPLRTNRRTRLIWIGSGTGDRIVGSGPAQLAATLSKYGIRNEFTLSGGGHSITNWRNYLAQFGSELFR